MLLLAAVLVGGGLRAAILNRSLWYDEAVMYWIAVGTPREVLAQNADRNSAPPTFALMLNAVQRLGESEAALRALPLLFGLFAIPAAYWLACQFLRTGPSLLAAWLFALSPCQIHYSAEVREYSLAVLLTILMLALFTRLLRRPTPARWALLTLAMGLSVWVQYGLALLILSLNLVFLVDLRRRPARLRRVAWWAAGQCLVAGAVAGAWLTSLRAQMNAGIGGPEGYLSSAYFQGTAASLWNVLVNNTGLLMGFMFGLALPLLVVLSVLGAIGLARDVHGRAALWLWAVPLTITMIGAIVRLYPYSGRRQDLFLTPMFYLLAAAGGQWLFDRLRTGQRQLATAATAILLTLLAAASLREVRHADIQPMKEVLATISRERQASDRVVPVYKARPAWYYYVGRGSRRWSTWEQRAASEQEICDEIDRAMASPGRVWLIFSHGMKTPQPYVDHARRTRKLTLIADYGQTWLYRAE
ncbi:MAG: hypothetical protein BIFFINMI_03369 [Phycisphaerae bacterium]|nr:hypothetical protein [Phycisphaerae bacterium]